MIKKGPCYQANILVGILHDEESFVMQVFYDCEIVDGVARRNLELSPVSIEI